MTTPDVAPDQSARHTIAPGPLSPRVETPPGLDAAPVPGARSASDHPLALHSVRVAVHGEWARTVRRTSASLTIGALIWYFESRGHALPGTVVAAITALGLGAEGIADALRKRPVLAAGGAAALLLLSLVGDAGGVHEVSLLAALGGGSIPLVDLIARRFS